MLAKNKTSTPTAETIAQDLEEVALTGTNDTHVQVFLQDIETAFAQAHAAINEVELKYQALRMKLGL